MSGKRFSVRSNNPLSTAGALFPRIRQRVLGLLFGHPEQSFYTSQLIRQVGGGSGAVQRELARLTKARLLTVHQQGTQIHYQANAETPVFDALCDLARNALLPELGQSRRSDGGLKIPRHKLQNLAQRYGIEQISLFGSAARGELRDDSDIDLLIAFKPGRATSLGGIAEISRAFSALLAGRKVDVVTAAILENPYRKREIEKDLELLYAA